MNVHIQYIIFLWIVTAVYCILYAFVDLGFEETIFISSIKMFFIIFFTLNIIYYFFDKINSKFK